MYNVRWRFKIHNALRRKIMTEVAQLKPRTSWRQQRCTATTSRIATRSMRRSWRCRMQRRSRQLWKGMDWGAANVRSNDTSSASTDHTSRKWQNKRWKAWRATSRLSYWTRWKPGDEKSKLSTRIRLPTARCLYPTLQLHHLPLHSHALRDDVMYGRFASENGRQCRNLCCPQCNLYQHALETARLTS